MAGEFRIEFEELSFGEEVGKGEFGRVWKGMLSFLCPFRLAEMNLRTSMQILIERDFSSLLLRSGAPVGTAFATARSLVHRMCLTLFREVPGDQGGDQGAVVRRQ